MNTDTLMVEQRREQELQLLRSMLGALYKETGGRGKWWQAVNQAITLTGAINSAKGARKIALQRKLDALEKRCSA